ncbi:MAG TPA: hypothetical protein VFV66_10030, partial [Nonomuraea sp.]|nr:hypothetical protein [Nonomuraea sp.]
ILSLFSAQPGGMRPASAGLGGQQGQQGQQMIPADAVGSLAELFKKYHPAVITDCFGTISNSLW